MKWKRLFIFTAAIALPILGYCASARSTNYSMDYTTVGGGGTVASSSNYSMVEVVKTKGVVQNNATSTNYSIKPVISAGTNTTAVADWSLYK